MTADNARWGELIDTLGEADGSSVAPAPDACAQALGEIFLYLDDELDDPRLRDRIADHLETCVDCVAAYDAEKLVRAVIARSCRGERASAELRQRIELFVRQAGLESAVTTITTTVTIAHSDLDRDEAYPKR